MIVQSQENGTRIDLSQDKGIVKTAVPFIANAHEGALFRTASNARSFAMGAGIVDGRVVRDEDDASESATDPIDDAVDRINAREAKNAEKIKAAVEQAKKFVGAKTGGRKQDKQHPIYRMTKGESEVPAAEQSENAS